jgi:hypothetical protein
MPSHSEKTLLKACRTLFGHETSLSRDFLDYLQPSGAKNAFRALAKAHHPDCYARSSAHVRMQQTERFREIRQAYDLISDFLEKRHLIHRRAPLRPAPQPSASYQVRSKAQQSKAQKEHTIPMAIPAIPLEFGMFSYFCGKVSYQQLIEALVWQRRQRPTLGAIAQEWAWLTEARVVLILGQRGHAARFGKRAIELGYLSPNQVDMLLKHQRSLQERIGQYFIDHGLMTEEEADKISQDLEEHNRKLGRGVTCHSRRC